MINSKFFLFLLISTTLFSQKKYSREISLVNDNDLFTSTYNDRYYTDGIFISYRYLSKKKKKNLEKKIIEWQIGHQMYTPFTAIVSDISLHDRPFSAYLYASYGINRVYKNKQLLKTSLQIGTIGALAFGKELQNFIHDIYNFKKAIGWKYQIKNAFGFNINILYNKFFTKDNSNHFDISWINNAKVGSVFIDISTGFFSRIGFKPLQQLENSIAFHTNLNNNNTNYKKEVASFIYLKPTISYVLYDATIQGSFFNTGSVVTKKIIPLKFDLEIGFRFTVSRFNFGYFYHYHTNKIKNLRFNNGNYYGQIMINYLLL